VCVCVCVCARAYARVSVRVTHAVRAHTWANFYNISLDILYIHYLTLLPLVDPFDRVFTHVGYRIELVYHISSSSISCRSAEPSIVKFDLINSVLWTDG